MIGWFGFGFVIKEQEEVRRIEVVNSLKKLQVKKTKQANAWGGRFYSCIFFLHHYFAASAPKEDTVGFLTVSFTEFVGICVCS